jgi:hypothetical protein
VPLPLVYACSVLHYELQQEKLHFPTALIKTKAMNENEKYESFKNTIQRLMRLLYLKILLALSKYIKLRKDVRKYKETLRASLKREENTI